MAVPPSTAEPSPSAAHTPALLQVGGLCKSFGAGVPVISDLSFGVAEGEVLGVLGPNGAGKTTLFNLITGDLKADAGTIAFAGSDVSSKTPWKRCQMGIGRTYQIPKPFAGMTVIENLLVAASFGARLALPAALVHVRETLALTELSAHQQSLAGGLRLLDRKRLELARALAAKPRLLLLDEIAGGLTDPEAEALVGLVKTIQARGVTIVWIEHVMHALRAAATRLIVLDFGRTIAEGLPAQVLQQPEVQRIYMGIET